MMPSSERSALELKQRINKNELKYARAWPPFPEMISIARNTITPYAQKAIIGELSPQAAIDKVAEEAKKIIGEMK